MGNFNLVHLHIYILNTASVSGQMNSSKVSVVECGDANPH
jgi:hypothetical protein